MTSICLSRQQEMVLSAFQIYKRVTLSQLSPIYTQSENLKLCLIRLEKLKLIRMAGPMIWEYIGPEIPGSKLQPNPDQTQLKSIDKKEERQDG